MCIFGHFFLPIIWALFLESKYIMVEERAYGYYDKHSMRKCPCFTWITDSSKAKQLSLLASSKKPDIV